MSAWNRMRPCRLTVSGPRPAPRLLHPLLAAAPSRGSYERQLAAAGVLTPTLQNGGRGGTLTAA